MRLAVLLVAACLACAQEGKRLDFGLVQHEVVEERLERLPKKADERRLVLTTLFDEAGCRQESLAEQPLQRTGEPNLLCTLEGGGESVIVVERITIARTQAMVR